MNEFSTANWQDALTKVFIKATGEERGETPAEVERYRRLCFEDARAALREVSDIELPDDFLFEFVPERRQILYSIPLPPYSPDESPEHNARNIIAFFVHCTQPTTGN